MLTNSQFASDGLYWLADSQFLLPLWRGASQMKTRLRNALSDCSLSHLMKRAIEAPKTLSDNEIVNVWQRKSRRVSLTMFILMSSK
jgi:hypothetical protein